MPPDILIAGCGDLGIALGQTLTAQGYRVSGLRRSPTSLPGDIQTLWGDVTQPDTLQMLGDIRPSILVYSVAAPAQSDTSYHAHYVEGLRNTMAALAPSGSLQHVFFISSTRPYGQVTDDLLDENVPAIPADFGGLRLLEAEALLATAPCPATALRLSGIYGPGRTRMLKLAADPSTWPLQNTWTNRIHRDDAARFIHFLIEKVMHGETVDNLYLVTDSAPVSQHEVLRWIASEMHIADLPPFPPVMGGKRLSNARMLATGFKLLYPGYQEGYAQALPSFLSTIDS